MPNPPAFKSLAAIGLFFSLLINGWGIAQENVDVELLQTRVEKFFENLNDENIDRERAFNDLLAEGPLRAREEVKQLIVKIDDFEKAYGQYVESEPVREKQIGKDLVLLRYLYKMEKYPIVWYFTYYRPPSASGEENEWVVIAVRFDTRLELLGL